MSAPFFWTNWTPRTVRALAGRRLLLHGLDGHNLVFELARGRGEEVIDDLVLLDRHRVKEDFLREKTGCETALRRLKKTPSADLERADAALLYEAAELGVGCVFLFH